jgi:NAD(P)-dependent dehydrogenase (short-subunit alcohol dehydrogenase family)
MPRDLAGAVVVITGGSSGIGRAAAVAFARRGSRLVLAARGERDLAVAAGECSELGAEAIAVPTDVRDELAVIALAARAAERFGRIDVWVNSAGVIAYGRFEETPSDVFRAVIETNLMGQVHGARAVVPYFRSQGDGVLINIASVLGRVTSADVSAYVTSKFAVRAFSECLRQELADLPGVGVATVLPQAVDTPIYANAANYSGRCVRPVPPVLDPAEIAEGILRCAESPEDEVTYRKVGRLLEIVHSVLPRVYQRVIPAAIVGASYARRSAAEQSGNVLRSVGSHEVSGGWREQPVELLRALLGAVAGGLRAGLAPAVRNR